jgi:hypothetical protein
MNTYKHGFKDQRVKRITIRFFLLGLVCVAVVGMGLGVFLGGNVATIPSYEGKTLDQWLEMKGGIEPLPDEAQEAVRHMGTNALPRLLELLAHKFGCM